MGAAWRLSISSEILPQIREYFRLSTTVINAYVAPVLGRYVEQLETILDARDVAPGRRFTMQSNGGSTTFAGSARLAAGTILSGPAGGVTAGLAGGKQRERGPDRGVAARVAVDELLARFEIMGVGKEAREGVADHVLRFGVGEIHFTIPVAPAKAGAAVV